MAFPLFVTSHFPKIYTSVS